MGMSADFHTRNVEVEVEAKVVKSSMLGTYPVVRFMEKDTISGVTLFPSIEQVEALRDELNKVLLEWETIEEAALTAE